MKKWICKVITVIVLAGLVTGLFLQYPQRTMAEPDGTVRYTVLLLDTSGPQTFTVRDSGYANEWGEKYTSNSSIAEVKQAAGNFLDNMESSQATNYIAIVGYDEQAVVYSDFTNDFGALKAALSSVSETDASRRSIRCGFCCVRV